MIAAIAIRVGEAWALAAGLQLALITGIPPTENQAVRSKGDAYRDYQRRVSKFVPMPPRR